MLLKFTTAGNFCSRSAGRSSGGNKDTKNLKEPADFAIYRNTNEAFIADGYGNRRVIVLDADTGVFKRMSGVFGNVPVDATPRRCGLALRVLRNQGLKHHHPPARRRHQRQPERLQALHISAVPFTRFESRTTASSTSPIAVTGECRYSRWRANT